jgi:polar amino acid transport system substrate-binding protein
LGGVGCSTSTKDPVTGELKGVWADLARAFAARIGVELVAFELLRTERVDAWASARPVLVDYSAQLPGSRVLEDRYGANRPALVVAKGQAARLAYISEFIEEIKASGFVQQAIARSGWRGVQVAPPASPPAHK